MGRSLFSMTIQMARAAERVRAKTIRDTERQAKQLDRLSKVLYAQSRQEEADNLNTQLDDQLYELSNLLSVSLECPPLFSWQGLYELPPDEKVLDTNPELLVPAWPAKRLPPPLRHILKLIPGNAERHSRKVAEAEAQFQRDEQRYKQVIRKRTAAYDKLCEGVKEKNKEVDFFKAAYQASDPEVVTAMASMALDNSELPDGFHTEYRSAFVLETRQLVVEYRMPTLDEVIPAVERYKYVKSRDSVDEVARAPRKRQPLYADMIAQLTLRITSEIFRADRDEIISSIVLNGYVETTDPATGKNIQPCLVSLRATREQFAELDLRRVEPAACLKRLNAAVSRSPAELLPVRPILEFNMVDPRFVEEANVLAAIDNRTNLMDLNPSEFESLITNLFQKMGLDTKLTRASRDGGVDCIAYDTRPILGGKVVIQAKRYKNTVGVSAVRDLFGTMHNEGANKGILVTTSGYGAATHEFASGKPIELISGGNLLYLLKEHAGIEAKIEMPDDCIEPLESGQ